MADYDIAAAFDAIEQELISSMVRNFKRHRAEERDMGFDWPQWQAEQLDALETYRRRNSRKFRPRFRALNGLIEAAIRTAYTDGGADQEKEILRAVQRGASALRGAGSVDAAFFRTNERKLNALVDATLHDMKRAETAILRRANDTYRKAIFNAQVYANTGAGTYEKAVDMATRDMAANGLRCVVYQNGAQHTLCDYADMALRTASKRAYLAGEGAKRQEWGVTTVIINKRSNACPRCARFAGHIFIDDVWSGGRRGDGRYPLLSSAIAQGLYHPRCKDSHTTCFPELSDAPEPYTDDEIRELERQEQAEEYQKYAQRQSRRFARLADYSLDEENRRRAQGRADEWEKRVENSTESGTIIPKREENGVKGVHFVGKISTQMYSCVTGDIRTDEVIITETQIAHIQMRHPDDFERYGRYLSQILADPDYILRDDSHPTTTAMVLREIIDDETGECFRIALRLATSEDDPSYKNSIITFLKIRKKEYDRLVRNKTVLYKRE